MEFYFVTAVLCNIFHLFAVYLWCQSMWRRMIKHILKCELEIIRRKFSWPNLKQYIDIYLEGLSKSTKNLGIAGVLADIRTWLLLNIST
jgi:hypothetical protein